MDIHQLEIFQQIVGEKSFSRAAKALGLTQPTASGHIKSLEKELGVRLFDRLGREVEPTQAGWILLDYAQKILQAREEARHALEDYQGIIRGHMSVAASSIPGGYLLPRFLGVFMQENPETSISIDILDSRKVIEGVLEGNFPIGVTGAQIPHDQLSYRLFAEDELILAIPKDHELAKRKRIKAKELCGPPMILREKGSGTRLVAEERLRAAGLDPGSIRVAAELGNPQAVRTALKAGVGISIVSRHAVEEDLVRGDLKEVKIEGFNCARSFYSVIHKGRSLTPLCRAFMEFIHSEGQYVLSGGGKKFPSGAGGGHGRLPGRPVSVYFQ